MLQSVAHLRQLLSGSLVRANPRILQGLKQSIGSQAWAPAGISCTCLLALPLGLSRGLHVSSQVEISAHSSDSAKHTGKPVKAAFAARNKDQGPAGQSRTDGSSQPDNTATSNRSEETVALDPALGFQASRFLQLHQHALTREMMLRMGAPRRWKSTPMIHQVVLTISAAKDTRLGSDDVDKPDLLLYQLALEMVAGGGRASFIPPLARRTALLASGVTLTLEGSRALNFIEKLVNVVLPNQMSFEGIGAAAEVAAKKFVSAHAPPANPMSAEPPMFKLDLQVDNLLLYPEFETNFELFEALRSMQVSIRVSGAHTAEMARSYVTGFGFPLHDLPAAQL